LHKYYKYIRDKIEGTNILTKDVSKIFPVRGYYNEVVVKMEIISHKQNRVSDVEKKNKKI